MDNDNTVSNGDKDNEEESCALLEASIRQEEALIRCLEAELRILKREQQEPPEPSHHQPAGTQGNDEQQQEEEEDDDMALEDLLLLSLDPSQQRQREEALASSSVTWNLDIVESNKTECWELTHALQGFVMEAVEHCSNQPTTNADTQLLIQQCDPSSLSYYTIQGHFVANPSVHAKIYLTTERTRKRKRSPNQVINCISRVVHLQGTLHNDATADAAAVNNTSSNHSWSRAVECLATAHAQPNSLADWIYRVADYVEFDKRQEHALKIWQALYPSFSWSRGGDNDGENDFSVKIHAKNQEAADGIPAFTWKWHWENERDVVDVELHPVCAGGNNKGNAAKSMSSNMNPFGQLDPQGLQDLVELSGSCEKALNVILAVLLEE